MVQQEETLIVCFTWQNGRNKSTCPYMSIISILSSFSKFYSHGPGVHLSTAEDHTLAIPLCCSLRGGGWRLILEACRLFGYVQSKGCRKSRACHECTLDVYIYILYKCIHNHTYIHMYDNRWIFNHHFCFRPQKDYVEQTTQKRHIKKTDICHDISSSPKTK